jgi:hypothetical protein
MSEPQAAIAAPVPAAATTAPPMCLATMGLLPNLAGLVLAFGGGCGSNVAQRMAAESRPCVA